LKRALQNYVEDPLAEEMLRGTFPEGSKVLVDLNKEKDELIFINAGKAEPEESAGEQHANSGDVVLEGDAPPSEGDEES
jgi:ATP-dependent Clp protease ATP-binding subunit ClpC